MVLHVAKGRVLTFDPDLASAQFLELLGIHQQGDAVEVIAEHTQRLSPFGSMLTLQQSRFDVHRPTLHVFDDRVEAHRRHFSFLGSSGDSDKR